MSSADTKQQSKSSTDALSGLPIPSPTASTTAHQHPPCHESKQIKTPKLSKEEYQKLKETIQSVDGDTGPSPAPPFMSFRKLDGWRRTVRSITFIVMLLAVTFSTTVSVWSVWNEKDHTAAGKGIVTSIIILVGGVVGTWLLMSTDAVEREY